MGVAEDEKRIRNTILRDKSKERGPGILILKLSTTEAEAEAEWFKNQWVLHNEFDSSLSYIVCVKQNQTIKIIY